jgi:cytidyltransferase-like protein
MVIRRYTNKNRNRIVFTSGYYLWLHKGHIECFHKARKLGDELIVILNNDKQQMLKYGRIIVPEMERMNVINALSDVGYCYLSIDDDRTVCKSLEYFVNAYMRNNLNGEMIFAKGGDRFEGEIPEKEICDKLGIKIVDGLGEKIQSSSALIKKYEE